MNPRAGTKVDDSFSLKAPFKSLYQLDKYFSVAEFLKLIGLFFKIVPAFLFYDTLIICEPAYRIDTRSLALNFSPQW